MLVVDKFAYVIHAMCDLNRNERCWRSSEVSALTRALAVKKLTAQGWCIGTRGSHACPACRKER